MKRGHEYRLKMLKVYPPAHGKRELLRQIDEAQELITQQVVRWRRTTTTTETGS